MIRKNDGKPRIVESCLKSLGKHIGAPEGTWVPVIGIEISRIYFLYGAKAHKIVHGRKIYNTKEI